MKGFKAVLMRVLETMGMQNTPATVKLDKYLEKMINSQNLQSASCIKAIGSFLRKSKPIVEDDLHNPIKTYQTTFDFLKEDIERYRDQKIKHQCFQVLHPWAYDLNTVDMRYIVNTNLEAQICQLLGSSVDAQIFWLSYFKPQLACPGDELIEAIREVAESIGLTEYFASQHKELQQMVATVDYVVNLETHAEMVIKVVADLIKEANATCGFSPLRHQLQLAEN